MAKKTCRQRGEGTLCLAGVVVVAAVVVPRRAGGTASLMVGTDYRPCFLGLSTLQFSLTAPYF